MMKNAVHFGAGKIGRGFIADLLHDSGYSITFLDTFEPVVACVLGYALIGDILTPPMIFGSVLIVAAVLLTNLPQPKPRLKTRTDSIET